MAEYDTPKEDVFELGQETKVEEKFKYDEEAPNLVTVFKKHPDGIAALKRLGTLARNNFKDAWDSCEEMRKNQADIWKYFSGNVGEKGPPFAKGMSNAHVPILMENTVRMVFRQCYELFGNWTNVFGVTPIGPDDEHIAKLLTLHGNWQIRKRIKDFKRQIGHRGLLIFDLFGDVTCHSYWDSNHKSNRHEILTANEFVCASAHVSTMPDYSDVSWVAKLIYMDAHELRKMAGAWEDVAYALKRSPPSWDDAELSQELREEVDKSIGIDQTLTAQGQYKIIQLEGWMNLPGQDRDRFCQIILDHSTSCVLSLGIHERIDPYDKRRFEFQMKQLEQYTTGMNEVQAFMQEKQDTKLSALSLMDNLDPSGDGPAQAVAMARAVDDMPAPTEPPMPDWMKGDPNAKPEPPATRPIRMFAHGVNIEPIQGIIGMGTGTIHLAQNKIANACLQIFIDQAVLGNMKNFLTSGGVRFPGGESLEVGLGKIHKVEGAVDLAKEIMPLDFGPANPQLLAAVENFIKYGNTVSNTPEVLSGESGKSGETAQGLSARIEQATKMLSVPTGKYADFLSQVLENNAALNAIFLDEAEFFSVNNHDPALGQMGMQSFTVGRDMYDRPYDVEISADLKFTSTGQRIAEADALVQLPNSVPALQANYALLFEVIKKSLEARNRYDLTALMGAPPPPPEMFGMPTTPPAPPPGMAPPPGAGAPPQGAPPPQQGATQ